MVIAGDPHVLSAGERAMETALGAIGLVPNPAKHRRAFDREDARALVFGRGVGLGSGIEILAES